MKRKGIKEEYDSLKKKLDIDSLYINKGNGNVNDYNGKLGMAAMSDDFTANHIGQNYLGQGDYDPFEGTEEYYESEPAYCKRNIACEEKQKIKITESELRQMIRETLKNIIS